MLKDHDYRELLEPYIPKTFQNRTLAFVWLVNTGLYNEGPSTRASNDFAKLNVKVFKVIKLIKVIIVMKVIKVIKVIKVRVKVLKVRVRKRTYLQEQDARPCSYLRAAAMAWVKID